MQRNKVHNSSRLLRTFSFPPFPCCVYASCFCVWLIRIYIRLAFLHSFTAIRKDTQQKRDLVGKLSSLSNINLAPNLQTPFWLHRLISGLIIIQSVLLLLYVLASLTYARLPEKNSVERGGFQRQQQQLQSTEEKSLNLIPCENKRMSEREEGKEIKPEEKK